MRYFVEICKSHSLNKAAQNLYVSQPALTKSVQALEKELNTQLLVRDKKGTYPTPIGEEVLENFRKIIALHDDIIFKINNSLEFYRPLTIYAAPAISNAFGAQLISDLVHKFKNLEINFQEIPSRELSATIFKDPTVFLRFNYNNTMSKELGNIPDLVHITIKEDFLYVFSSKNYLYTHGANFDADSTKHIRFRENYAIPYSHDVKMAAVYCDNVALAQELILKKNYVHILPLSLGRLLYCHPDIEAVPLKNSAKIQYELFTSSRLLETNYQHVIQEIIVFFKSALED